MKEIIKRFLIIIIAFITMLVVVYKPYKSEVVDLSKFTEYYSEKGTVEDGGGLALVDNNFYTIEREYKIGETAPTPSEKEINLETSYVIPKVEKYIVTSGDTLGSIATANGVSLGIMKANNPNLSKSLKIGQEINVVKGNGVFYRVKRGDSLFKIALDYKVDIDALREYNSLKSDNIRIGEELFIRNPSEETLKRLEQRGNNKPSKLFIMPIKYAGVTSPFGKRFHPVLKRYIYHAGVDLRAHFIPVEASRTGVVTYAGYMHGYGKIIIVKHNSGYETRYAHLSKIKVRKGQRVKVKQVIAISGMSGRVTGPHLHFEIRRYGKPSNPMKFVR
ncbi:M23 family metallopeptidase [uncultured Cetobacterium sp.]|uniref:peptidoglycan DD-metalloendopeptidase family protein n=1 Tax=uncultured Cetobacterium sp. TaxID=527638 RepID=UPI00262CA3DE|nr:M23 family metallopeptidase [uncultured Cetobacterium sp.]